MRRKTLFKKNTCLLLAAVIAAAAVLPGCGNTENTAEEKTENASEDASVRDVPGKEAVTDEELTDDNIGDFVTVGNWKNISIYRKEGTDLSAYPEPAQAFMGYIRDYSNDVVDYDRTINLSYEGKIDGKAFDGGSSDNAQLVIGSHQFIDDFEDQLVGAKVGDTVTVDVTFPDDYGQADLAGKDAEFTCRIFDIYQSLFSSIVSTSTFAKYPQAVYDQADQSIQALYENYASSYNMDVDDFLAYAGLTEDDVQDKVLDQVRMALVAKALLVGAGITHDSQEYKDMYAAVEENLGYKGDDASTTDGQKFQLDFSTEYLLANQLIVNANEPEDGPANSQTPEDSSNS